MHPSDLIRRYVTRALNRIFGQSLFHWINYIFGHLLNMRNTKTLNEAPILHFQIYKELEYIKMGVQQIIKSLFKVD